MGVGAALLTAFYSTRLLIMTFHGKPRGDEVVMAHVHESPPVMLLPLLPLAAGAMLAGYLGYENFGGHHVAEFWGQAITAHDAIAAAHNVPAWVKYSPLVVGVVGILAGIVMYGFAPSLPKGLASAFPGIYRFLDKKWYFDELYDLLFVRTAFYLGRGFWKAGDGQLIDGVGPDGIAAATMGAAKRVAKLQTGYLYHGAFAMAIGVMVLVSWYMLTH